MQRRTFLSTAAQLAAAPLLLGSRTASGQSLPADDYRALVGVFLLGGNDSFNMVAPRSAAEHQVYARARQNLAIAQDALVPINPLSSDGAQYGFHPRMAELARLFDAGELAVVANVGPLVRPTTKAEVLARSAALPPQLFSHNDQQDQWSSLKGQQDLQTGWAGRAADALEASVAAQQLPSNLSLAGSQLLQIGQRTLPYTVTTQGAANYFVLSPGAGLYAERRAMFERLLALRGNSPIQRAFAAVNQRALATADRVSQALSGVAPLATPFPATDLGRQLSMVARLIAARQALGMRRQIFLVAAGGWDTHDDQIEQQPNLLGNLAACLQAFHGATVELGVADRVTSFTLSDFGRTLTSNGDGTDHGWGGHQLVLGGAVRGREIYGAMPRLELGGPDDIDAGRIVPTTSVHQYAATLLRWWGLSDSQLDAAAPGLAAFPSRTLGFLG
jgi:uncharacterized protein (DUF1501 family)